MTKSPFTEKLFEYRSTEKKKLVLSLVITTVVMFVEVIGGILTGSIALVSDAGHMFTHSFAITISLIAIIIAKKPPCHHRTFGLYRAEILAAFINGLFLLAVAGLIIYESILRIIEPEEILSLYMLVIAFIGLAVNLVSILILHGSHKGDLNIKSVFYHMIADAVSSIGIIIAAVIIYFTGWNILDPVVSIGISLVILQWSYGVLKDSARILLEMAPPGVSSEAIADDIKKTFPGIKEVDRIHLWTITADMLVFSAHVTLDENIKGQNRRKMLDDIDNLLSEKYNIIESTIQLCC
ncbi:cation diffusion facilitator family transporter [candidate division KSB1 bacterium]